MQAMRTAWESAPLSGRKTGSKDIPPPPRRSMAPAKQTAMPQEKNSTRPVMTRTDTLEKRMQKNAARRIAAMESSASLMYTS